MVEAVKGKERRKGERKKRGILIHILLSSGFLWTIMQMRTKFKTLTFHGVRVKLLHRARTSKFEFSAQKCYHILFLETSYLSYRLKLTVTKHYNCQISNSVILKQLNVVNNFSCTSEL